MLEAAIVELQRTPEGRLRDAKARTLALALIVVASYLFIIWDVTQPVISPIVFAAAFAVAMAGSIMLGTVLSRRDLRRRAQA